MGSGNWVTPPELSSSNSPCMMIWEVRPRLTVVPVTSRLPTDTHRFLVICFNVKLVQLLLSLWLGLLCMASVPPTRGDAPRTGREVDFNEQVRPILARHCFKCHGPDEKARKARLRLDAGDEALKPASSGERPIVPGHPDESELVRRIFAEEPARPDAATRSQAAARGWRPAGSQTMGGPGSEV